MFILIIKQKASISCITRQNGMFWQLSKISRMFQVPGFGPATAKEEALGILSLEVRSLSDGWGRPELNVCFTQLNAQKSPLTGDSDLSLDSD